jgi:hypothetical protein
MLVQTALQIISECSNFITLVNSNIRQFYANFTILLCYRYFRFILGYIELF